MQLISTNNVVYNHSDARKVFENVFNQLPLREFDPSWVSPTDYMDPMVCQDLNVGQGFASINENGRRLLVLPGFHGNVVYFDRYDNRQGPVCCNGYLEDITPSFFDVSMPRRRRSPSGYCVDDDQLAEQLIKRVS